MHNDAAALEKELLAIEDNLDHAITEIRNFLAENQTAEQLQAGSLERRLKEELNIFSARTGFKSTFIAPSAPITCRSPSKENSTLPCAKACSTPCAIRARRSPSYHWRAVSPRYRATLSDNGVGFAAAAVEGSNHYGLKGMRERIEKTRRHPHLQTAPGKGTHIEIEIPIPASRT